MGPESVSTAVPSSLYPIIPPSWLAEAVSWTPVSTERLSRLGRTSVRLKWDSLSVEGPGSNSKLLTLASLNAPGAAARAQRDSFQQNDLYPIVPKVVAQVKVVHFDGPDKQVEEVKAEAQPGTDLPDQPDEPVHRYLLLVVHLLQVKFRLHHFTNQILVYTCTNKWLLVKYQTYK